jgi:hypothetical protein
MRPNVLILKEKQSSGELFSTPLARFPKSSILFLTCIAAITEPTVAKRILDCMGLPPRAPPLTPACTSGFAADPWLEDTEAGDFDQSPPDDRALGA